MKKNLLSPLSTALAVSLVVGAFCFGSCSNNSSDVSVTTDTTDTSVTEPAVTEEQKSDFVSVKDFSAITAEYPHAYAWIEVPGTNIDYAIIQHPEDDNYYLRRDEAGNYSINGCIFTEHVYNNTDFSDPVTLIYGHYVREWDGFKYFGGLQTFYRNDLETYKEIIIYHPDKELHYEVFAAVPHNDYHILSGKDYTDSKQITELLDEIKGTDAYDATVNMECLVTAKDRYIILSTCYNGSDTARFLVMAKLVEEIN